MTIKILDSKAASMCYFGGVKFTGGFRAVSATRITITTTEYGVMTFPFTDIEYIQDSNVMNLITVLSRMENFNATGKVNITVLENNDQNTQSNDK